jgi:hypothetical protein
MGQVSLGQLHPQLSKCLQSPPALHWHPHLQEVAALAYLLLHPVPTAQEVAPVAYLAAMGWLAELHPVGWLAELQPVLADAKEEAKEQPVLADPKQSRPKVVQACLAKLVQASLLEASLHLQQLQASLHSLQQLHGVGLQALEAARACS